MQVLRNVAARGHNVTGVLTREPTAESGIRGATVSGLAATLGYPTLPAELVTDPTFADRVRHDDVDLILNIHSLFIMDGTVAASARIGAFNLHPGPLPAYAGLNAPSWAILRGEDHHGVTVHWMDAGVDTGPIAYQSTFPLSETDTGLSVARRCVHEGLALIDLLLDTASTDPASVPRRPQDLSLRSYFGRKMPHGGAVDWSWPARYVVDFVRACDHYPLPSPWGYPTARTATDEIALARARTTGRRSDLPPGTVQPTGDGQAVRIACGDEWIDVTHVWRDRRRRPAAQVLRDLTFVRSGHLTSTQG